MQRSAARPFGFTWHCALALLLGVLAVQALPSLPSFALDAALALAAVSVLRRPHARLIAIAMLGFAWCAWRAQDSLDARLPRDLEGHDLDLIGAVDDLPNERADVTRFLFRVERAETDGADIDWRGLVRLAWFAAPAGSLQACRRWQLRARLKRPRGLVDPGGFDFERHALERGIVATGYVREEGPNRALDAPLLCVDRLRDRLAREIGQRVADPHDAALIRAFAIGDTRGLDGDDWAVARTNGIPHLIAISGFHVGVAAGLGALMFRALWWLLPALALRIPRAAAEVPAALVTASFYGVLAGGSLPTVRTLVMIAVIALARVARRACSGAQSLALALGAILIVDPLAVLSPGFWLSFVGVAFLMACLARGRGVLAFVREMTRGQLVMTFALLPLTVWFFGEASLIGAFSNLIAVPFVSFVIVPLCLAGVLALLIVPSWATPLLALAGVCVHGQWRLLEMTASLPGAHAYLPEAGGVALMLAMLGSIWMLVPRGAPLRSLGAVLLLPLLWPPRELPDIGAFDAVVIDVGQGLSVLVRTHEHVLLYDAGARHPGGFDLGASVVLPTLHALGVNRLDLLMVSHGDNDHAGGAPAVAREFPHAERLGGEPARSGITLDPCVAGQHWEWDRVRFTMLSPEPDASGPPPARGDNDRSCVLLIEGEGGRLLLPGDVSRRVEPAIAARIGDVDKPLVLIVPHHGSRSSSSEAFVAATHPRLAVVSAGWRSRFGHPHPEIVERYREAGTDLRNTAADGAVRIAFPADGPPRARGERARRPRYWRE